MPEHLPCVISDDCNWQERQKFLPTVTESIQEQGADLERDVDDSTS